MDGIPKPVLSEISKFTTFIENFPHGALPERIVDAVCILTAGQDTWGAAYSAFILAKQAGMDIEYQYSTQPVKDAKLYLLPSLKGDACISHHRMVELLEKVKNGAVLYISIDTSLLSPFSEYSGIRVLTREKRADADTVSLDGTEGKVTLDLKGTYKFNLEVMNAEVIGTDQDGKPAFTCAHYGMGKVFFLNYPVETYLLDKPGAFHQKGAKPYWSIYRHLKNSIDSGKVVCKDIPNIGITEHILNEYTRIVIVINYEPEFLKAGLTFSDDWKIKDVLYGSISSDTGSSGKVSIPINKNDAVVFTIAKV